MQTMAGAAAWSAPARFQLHRCCLSPAVSNDNSCRVLFSPEEKRSLQEVNPKSRFHKGDVGLLCIHPAGPIWIAACEGLQNASGGVSLETMALSGAV